MNPAFVRPHRLHLVQTGLAFAVASLLAVAPSDAQSLRLTRSTVVSDVDEGMGTIHTGELQLLLPLRGSRVSARSSLSYISLRLKVVPWGHGPTLRLGRRSSGRTPIAPPESPSGASE